MKYPVKAGNNEVREDFIVEPDPGSANSQTKTTWWSPRQDPANSENVLLIDTSLTLPQTVDASGITCLYEDGLLRIEIPIVPPGPDYEHLELIASLELSAKTAGDTVNDLDKQIADLEQQKLDQKANISEAQTEIRNAKINVVHMREARRHQLHSRLVTYVKRTVWETVASTLTSVASSSTSNK